jgi:hypothetical protein
MLFRDGSTRLGPFTTNFRSRLEPRPGASSPAHSTGLWTPPPDTRTFRKRTEDETFSSMGADEGPWTELHPSHPGNLGWDRRGIPLSCFSPRRTRPIAPHRRTRSTQRARPRQERHHLCGNLVFGPPYLARRPCVLNARRTCSLTILHHTHGVIKSAQGQPPPVCFEGRPATLVNPRSKRPTVPSGV